MKNVVKSKNPTTDAVEGFKMLVDAYKEYQNICEVEHTKREAIAAWKEVQLTEANNQRKALEIYLKERFNERRHVIDKMFQVLDSGIENDNPELIAQAMSSIENTVKVSPLQEAAEMLTALRNPSNTGRIEF